MRESASESEMGDWESGARGIHICHHLCSLSSHLLSSSANLATKKQKKRKIPRIHLLIPHHLALTSQILQFSFLSSLALLCTLISERGKKDFLNRQFFAVRS